MDILLLSPKYPYWSETFPSVSVIPNLKWPSSPLSANADYVNCSLSWLPAQFGMGLSPGLHRSHAPTANLESEAGGVKKQRQCRIHTRAGGSSVRGSGMPIWTGWGGLSWLHGFQAWVSNFPREFLSLSITFKSIPVLLKMGKLVSVAYRNTDCYIQWYFFQYHQGWYCLKEVRC